MGIRVRGPGRFRLVPVYRKSRIRHLNPYPPNTLVNKCLKRNFRHISFKQKPYPCSLIAPSADYTALCFEVVGFLAVRSTSLFKLENRNRTRLVQKPKWTRLRGKSKNVYSGTRTFWFFRDRSNIKSVYRSTHFHFCPAISSILASVPISCDFDFPA